MLVADNLARQILGQSIVMLSEILGSIGLAVIYYRKQKEGKIGWHIALDNIL
jgi:hypothetical protein